MSADIPDKIDRYEIHQAIGFGAMGAVYKAFDPIIKRPVALKTIRLDVPPGSPDYRAFLERFATEARTAGRLSHPNIVTLYDVGHTPDQVPWLAMEFVQGQTVADILEKERLKPELVIGLVSQIASAVDYAHREGVIHRDIKPSNVMVHGGEKVKVTDFGIASFMDAERTSSGLMMGTPSYMSPEQAMGETLDGRTDIFSLGVVAFEMLSGQQPFPGNNVTSILYKLVHADPIHPDDLEVLGLLPHRWHDVFQRVLAKDPRERYAHAAEFVRDLELCLGSWFGGLDGRTVTSDGDGDETLLDGGAGMAVSDVTVQTEPKAARAPDPATRELEKPVGSASNFTSASASASGSALEVDDDETLVVPPPSDEDTLYADPPVDVSAASTETSRASQAARAAAADVPTAVPTATIRRPKSLPKWLFAASGLGALLLLTVIVAFMRGEQAPPEPDPLPPPPPVVDSGRVSIRTEPSGATVLLDGEDRGQTPLELPEVSLGEHAIAVRLEGFEDEDVTAQITELAPQAAFELELRAVPPPPPPKRAEPRPSFIQVDSQPSGAKVEIDGRVQGATPSGNVRVAPGERVVRVLLDGFLPWEDTIVVGEGQTQSIAAELTPRGGISLGEEPLEPPPPPPPSTIEGSLVDRDDPALVRPRCIECPPVPYPEAARRARVEGVVLLAFIVDENGRVTEPVVQESGGDIFDSAVIDGVRKWRYQPATKDGVRVKVRWVQRFRFEQGR